MSKMKVSKLKWIKDFDNLIEYLRDELDWPIDIEDAVDITFLIYLKFKLGLQYSPDKKFFKNIV
ncbi:MAG: hypothetical protein ACXAC5_15060 [Promethearchaeota archaeon]|jgi:hypothetical protein